MTDHRLTAGRGPFARGAAAAGLLVLALSGAVRADDFPFDRELILDARPMRPAKRMPILTVAPSGNAVIDLWCKTVPGRVEVSGAAIRIEAGPLPEELPAMMSSGQCTPQRMQADQDMLAALTQVTGWQRRGSGVMLVGPVTLRFRASDH